MALPSQGGFSSSRGGGMYRRHRRRRSTSWIIVFCTAIAITWFLWPTSNDDDVIDEVRSTIATEPEAEAIPPEIEVPIEVANDTDLKEVIEESPQEIVIQTPGVINPPEAITTPIPLVATTSANLEEGLALLDMGQLVDARLRLSRSLRSGTLSESEASQARGVLTDISDKLVFSKELVTDDPYAIDYVILSGDTLSGIVQKMGLQVNWRFIQRINNINQATSIRPGQNIKLVTGPFHAIVNKDTYRIDVYLGEETERVFVRSYRVGLGEFNSTPTGLFKVRRNSKLVNPTWVNPRTRESFSADDPANPIGERWIGLQGIQEQTKDLSGLGIHGTIDPDSIGSQSSMGCIRMHGEDVAQVYEMLSEGVSIVEIR